MAERTWNLRFNLDDFNAALAALADDVERAQFLLGLSAGANAGRLRDGAPEAWAEGFALGAGMRDEADNYRDRKVQAGQKSAEVRRAKSGTAQPRRTEPEQNPNSPRTVFEPCFEQDSNQSTIHNPQEKKEEAKASSSPVVLLLPCNGTGKKEFPITEADLTKWKEAFPGVDPLAEARRMKLWLESSPTKRKTFNGTPRFALSWLGRAQNDPRTPSQGATHAGTQTHRFAGRDAALLAQISGPPLPEVPSAHDQVDPWEA